MKLSRRNTEIRDQSHLMDAEGSSDFEPTEGEIQELLAEYGWIGADIEVFYDHLQGSWKWYCNITKQSS